MNTLILKPGREKSLKRRHPWVFSGAIASVRGTPQSGDTIEIRDAAGKFVAQGAWSPESQIAARVWSFSQEKIDESFLRSRIQKALRLRAQLVAPDETDSLRLVHGESDGLPGLIVDRYAGTLVMQLLFSGAEKWRETISRLLIEETGCERLYERSDTDARELEGLPPRSGAVKGSSAPVPIFENGCKFLVDVAKGQKTGFYLDQRKNRALVGKLAAGREVLNAFCYSGGFTVHALQGGARSVLSLDASGEALELGRENVRMNGLDEAKCEWLQGDAFRLLREFRDRGRQFDLVILDPPKFAPTASFAEKAARGYKDINILGFKLLRPGGVLATFSCSSGVSEDLFQKIVASAALDAGVDANIVEKLGPGPDHPISLAFPEGAYLKGLLCST